MTPDCASMMEALQMMGSGMSQCRQAFHSFMILAQNHDFESAARCQVNATAALESAMDNFMNACRQEAIMLGYDDLSDGLDHA